jgi:hypothetical protein
MPSLSSSGAWDSGGWVLGLGAFHLRALKCGYPILHGFELCGARVLEPMRHCWVLWDPFAVHEPTMFLWFLPILYPILCLMVWYGVTHGDT